MATSSEEGLAHSLLDWVRAARPEAAWWLICVDGRAGSGKTTVATQIAAAEADIQVVHLDALYDGWGGLAGIAHSLEVLLSPLRLGTPGTHPRYDWHAGRYAGEVTVRPQGVIVVEGVGAGSAPADLIDLLVWVEAEEATRKSRAFARDGATFAPHWEAWAEAEQVHYARHPTRTRAEVRLVTEEPPHHR